MNEIETPVPSRGRLRFAAMFFVTVLSMPGCGGGGGGGGHPGPGVSGNGFAPASGPGDTMAYFPSSVGNEWFYNTTNNDPKASAPNGYVTDSVTGTKAVLGVTATVVTDTDTTSLSGATESYYYISPGGVTVVGNNDPKDLVTSQIAPYVQLLFPVRAGPVSSLTAHGLTLSYDSSGKPITIDFTQTVNNIGTEVVTTSAGTFTNALKQVSTVNGTATDSATGQAVGVSGTVTSWLAPGIGLVDQTTSATAGGITVTHSQDLRGYFLGGVQHGLGTPYVAIAGLGSGNSNVATPGAPAVATDGTNFLVVGGNLATNPMTGKLLSPGGNVIATLTFATSSTIPVAAFDGMNYWVVFTGVAGSNAVQSCLVQRVSASGTILDSSPVALPTSTHGCGGTQSVIFGGGQGLIVFPNSAGAIAGVFVNPDGSVRTTEFQIGPSGVGQGAPVVSYDGTNFLVVWQQGFPSCGFFQYCGEIYAARVSPSAVVLDNPAIPISRNGVGQSNPSVAFDGSNYLISWLDVRSQPTPITSLTEPDIFAARLSPAGVLLDGTPSGAGVRLYTGGTQYVAAPQVMRLGPDCLVMWGSMNFAGNGGLGIQGTRVITSGAAPGVGAPIMISGPPPTSTTSLYVYPVAAGGSTVGLIAWLNNAETLTAQKTFMASTIGPF